MQGVTPARMCEDSVMKIYRDKQTCYIRRCNRCNVASDGTHVFCQQCGCPEYRIETVDTPWVQQHLFQEETRSGKEDTPDPPEES